MVEEIVAHGGSVGDAVVQLRWPTAKPDPKPSSQPLICGSGG